MAKEITFGVLPFFKGQYEPGASYSLQNQVVYQGSTYQSLIDNNTQAPADSAGNPNSNWICVAKGNDFPEKLEKNGGIDTSADGKVFIKGVGESNGTAGNGKDVATFLKDGGAMRTLYESAGAKWNPKTGFYELNGLTDITDEQMVEIYNTTNHFRNSSITSSLNSIYYGSPIRTNIKFNHLNRACAFSGGVKIDASFMFTRSGIEVVSLRDEESIDFTPNNMEFIFYDCFQLKSVLGVINCGGCVSLTDAFHGCYLLQEIKLLKLNKSIDMQWSPILDISEDKENGSLAYMVHNALGTSSITITLAKVLEGKIPQSILTEAQTKQITLAFA